MKKLMASILAVTMIFAMSSTVFATELSPENAAQLDGRLIKQNGTISSSTVDDIRELVHERNRAIISGDKIKEDQFQQMIENAGAYQSTPEEIAVLTDNIDDANALASNNVTYNTIQYSVTVNGTTYQVKETISYPTTNSNLFHSASINNKSTSSSVSAGSYELLKVSGSLAAGAASPYLGVGITAYDALKSVLTGFSKSTTIYGITANYSCAALEQVSFYQVYLNGYWTPFASSSYVQTAFSSTIFSTNYGNVGNTGLTMDVISKEDTLYSTYSLNSSGNGYTTSNILARYFTSYIFDKKSQVMSATFYHDADGTSKSIKSFGMLCPTTTADIT